MNQLKRYWAASLILAVVITHALIIGYVRSRVSRLNRARSTAIEIGAFRFQNIKDSNTVYQFRLYAIADPSRRNLAEESIKQLRVEIIESAEQLLRQVDPTWLVDPAQLQIRDRLMDVVGKHLTEPVIQRVIITDWLELPASLLTPTLATLNDPSVLDENDTPGAAHGAKTSHEATSHDAHGSDDSHGSKESHGSEDEHGSKDSHGGDSKHGSEASHSKPAAAKH